MSEIEWSPWIKNQGECQDLGYVRVKVRFRRGDESGGISTASEWPHWDLHGGDMAITHYRIPMEDYKRITGMPEWGEAPEWAQWLAQDFSGHWYWYSHEPHKEMTAWDHSDMIHRHTDKPMTVLGDWRDTLQERPRDQLASHPDSELDADQYSVGADTIDDSDDQPPLSKYHREIAPGVWVDVYDVLKAWSVTNPALQHLVKKALAPGERGHKTLEQDMKDILASAKRAQELA